MSENNFQQIPRVTVIIPCRNEVNHIESCLESIRLQKDIEGGFEVIIADGMSNDGTRILIRNFCEKDNRFTLVDNPEQIVPTALNAGINAARGEIIIRMDAHTQFAKDYIYQCMRILEESGADNVGGPWIAQGGETLRSQCIAAAFQSPFAVGGARSHRPDYEGEVDSVYLGCWWKKLFDEIGLFDEELIRNQDDEFCLRMTRAGKRIFQSPAIKSWYTPRKSLKALWKQYFQYGFWKIRVMQKHHLPASIRHIVPMLFVAGVIFGFPLSFLHPVLSYFYWGVIGIYIVKLIVFSLLEARKNSFKMLFLFPLVFLIFHFAYGLGSIYGVIHFILLRKTGNHAKKSTTRLTR